MRSIDISLSDIWWSSILSSSYALHSFALYSSGYLNEETYTLVLRQGELRSADYPVDTVSGLGQDNLVAGSGLLSDAAVAGVTSKIGFIDEIDFPMVLDND